MTPRPHHRCGIGLLLVLVTLALSVTAAAALARLAANTRLRASLAADLRTADALALAAEAPILDWLHRHAGRVVLPPEAPSPRFLILDDALPIAGRRCRVTITAFDQCAMLSPVSLRGPLRSALGPDVLAAIDACGDSLAAHPGLDLLAACPGEPRAFPSAATTNTPALGELLATHNPPRPGGAPVLNVNTAPMHLVAAVYSARALGALDALSESRAAGRIAAPGASPPLREGVPDSTPLPVAMSTCWAFRIDCRAGDLRRSWWCIYADTGSNWERIQRLAINE